MPNITDVSSLRDLLSNQLGVVSEGQDSTGTIAAAATDQVIVKNNPARVALSITNTHATATMTLRPLLPAAAGNGIQISPGQTLSLKWFDDFERTQYEWHAITDTINTTFYVQEQLIRRSHVTPTAAAT